MRKTMKMLALALMVAMLCTCLNVMAEGDAVANVLEFIVEEPVAETPAGRLRLKRPRKPKPI